MTEIDALALRVQLPGFPGTTLPGEVLDLLHEGLGGICLFGSNTAAGSHALAELTATIEEARPKAVVAVDEEGGDVSRLYAREGSPVLGAAALGAADDLVLTRATGRAVGADLAAVGVTLDLAPVADINTNPDNPVIGTRSFGADHERVAAHVAAWVEGLREAGVGACAKHFPGHGDTAQDSHLDLPTVDTDLDTLRVRELAPFAAAISAGADAVMTSHLLVRAVDPDTPATLSRRVLGLLRDRLGFHGAVVTDALDMVGVSGTRTVAEAAVLALAAGADLLCLGAEKDVALVRDVQAAVVAAVRSGLLAEERLRDAAARVDRLADLPPRDAPLAEIDDAAQLAGATTRPAGGGAPAGPHRRHRRSGHVARLDRRWRGAVGAPRGRRTHPRRPRRRRRGARGAAGARHAPPPARPQADRPRLHRRPGRGRRGLGLARPVRRPGTATVSARVVAAGDRRRDRSPANGRMGPMNDF